LRIILKNLKMREDNSLSDSQIREQDNSKKFDNTKKSYIEGSGLSGGVSKG
jgi:hypothetical protein